jgi:5-methylcytosine-specific restriction endonuclease McrA
VEESSPVKRKSRTEKERYEIFHSTQGVCYLCRDKLVFENRKKGLDGAWHIEHVIPFSKRPDLDHPANLLPAHVHCNLVKSSKRCVPSSRS